MEGHIFRIYTHDHHTYWCQRSIMITFSHKIIGFSLLLPLYPWGMTAMATSLPVIENLVEFSPEPDQPACHGVRISEGLIATSPLCVEKVREITGLQNLGIHTVLGKPIGDFSDNSLTDQQPENEMLLPFTPNEEGGEFDIYPKIYNARTPPEQVFGYTLNKKDPLAVHPVMVSLSETVTERVFNAFPEIELPTGSPVFDTGNHLVCLLTSDYHCQALNIEHESRFERDLAETDDPTTITSTSTPSSEESGVVLGIVLGVPIVAATIATTIFYLASYMKAKSMGMPGNVFWPGILGLQYCGHCNSQSATFAIIGFFCCPICLCPISAYLAVSNWVDDYAGGGGESAPIVTQPY